MADIKVRDLTDTSSIALDNQIMVLTNDEQNQVQNITVGNLLSNVLSSDNGNVLEQRTDGKLYVETPENITGDLADLDTVNKTSLVNSINEVVSNLSNEATTRLNADNNLQSQIDAITSASDVTDIVGTYAQLQAYDTTGLPDNSIIKVLQDESRQNETTYYRWVITGGVGAWVLIGEEGPYYTKSQADSLFATQQTTGNLASLDTSDKTSLVNAINELSSVLDPTQTADYINNSKAIESGAVSSNSIILSNVIKYAHSSFDLSKFTVVGSPNITDDGIASGFSSGNRLDTILLDITKPWQVQFPMKQSKAGTGTGGIINFNYGQSSNHTNEFYNNGIGDTEYGLKLRLVLSDNSVIALETPWNADFLYDIFYDTIIGWDGSTYFWKYKKTTETEWTIKSSDSLLPLKSPTTPNLLRIGMSGYNYADGLSIDLKQFSITVDGVEVFSGNKTGIDTIKPDDYTVVGTPTISADGVASGFSSSNYVKITSISATGTIEKVSAKFIINETNTANDVIFRSGSIWVYINTQATGKKFSAKQPSQYGSEYLMTSFTPVTNTWYTAELILNKETQKLTAKCYFNGTEVASATVNSTLPTLFSTDLIIGQYDNSGLLGSIDLNSFKIYVDGNLVYQPCLKIPYTKGSEQYGGKYVNAQYLPRVKDAYEQGLANDYFTLDEANGTYTLPMGNLYGMIENKVDKQNLVEVPAVIISTYQNGTSWCNIYSNGFCEQSGIHTSTSTNWEKVMLLKTYKDKNYSVIAVNSGEIANIAQVKVGSPTKNDVDGFYVAINYSGTDCWWRTSGYLAEGEY